MKYLIPTDFSEYADYALQMGINLAHVTDAEIHLIHSMDHINNITKFNLGKDKSEELDQLIEQWATEKLEMMKREISKYGLQCITHLYNGRLIDDIKNQIANEDYDMVIMGSHGASGKEEWFIGSNTSKVVRKIHENVLVVKKPVASLDFSEVVFVTGLSVKEQKALKIFLDFIEPFDVKEVHIMSVDTLNYFSQPSIIMKEALKDFKEIANNSNVKCHFYTDYSIQAGIRHFTEEYKIDLIGISNYVRHPIKRIFLGSNVEMLVNHSDIPVLSIDYK